jgi:hypothetical protein
VVPSEIATPGLKVKSDFVQPKAIKIAKKK